MTDELPMSPTDRARFARWLRRQGLDEDTARHDSLRHIPLSHDERAALRTLRLLVERGLIAP